MRKLLSAILVLAVLLTLALPVLGAEAKGIAPRYADAGNVDVMLVISSSGAATVRAVCQGDSGVTGVDLGVSLQKKVGTGWVTISGCTWTEEDLDRCFSKSYRATLTSPGEYRAFAYFCFYSSTPSTVCDYSYAVYDTNS